MLDLNILMSDQPNFTISRTLHEGYFQIAIWPQTVLYFKTLKVACPWKLSDASSVRSITVSIVLSIKPEFIIPPEDPVGFQAR